MRRYNYNKNDQVCANKVLTIQWSPIHHFVHEVNEIWFLGRDVNKKVTIQYSNYSVVSFHTTVVQQ